VSYLTVQDIVELHKAVSVEFGGTQASPGMVESQFGLLNAVQRPQLMSLGKEVWPSFSDKASAFLFALLLNSPFHGGNRRVALASLIAFCELNHRVIDGRIIDEKALENLIKRAASFRDLGLQQENVFHDLKDLMARAIVSAS